MLASSLQLVELEQSDRADTILIKSYLILVVELLKEGITWDLIGVPSRAPFELIFPSDTSLRDTSTITGTPLGVNRRHRMPEGALEGSPASYKIRLM